MLTHVTQFTEDRTRRISLFRIFRHGPEWCLPTTSPRSYVKSVIVPVAALFWSWEVPTWMNVSADVSMPIRNRTKAY